MPLIISGAREHAAFPNNDNKSPSSPSVLPQAPVDDMTLIKNYCAHGDVAAAAELLGRYEHGLYNFIWQTVRHHQDAEDARQETICKALEGLPQFRQQSQFKTWLYRIGHHEAINIVRKRRRLEIHESPEQLPGAALDTGVKATPSDHLEQCERTSALEDAIGKLPVHERQVVLLRLQEDMPFKEIARVMDAPLGTVLGRMRNARQRLYTLLSRSLAE